MTEIWRKHTKLIYVCLIEIVPQNKCDLENKKGERQKSHEKKEKENLYQLKS